MTRSARASSSAAAPVGERRRPWPGRADPGPGTGPVTAPCSRSSSMARANSSTPSQDVPVDLGPRHAGLAAHDGAAQASERSRKSAGSNSASEMPSSRACAARSILFCCNGFCTTTWAADDPDEVRQRLRAAPAGHQSERDLRQRDRRHAAGEGPVVAMQRKLQPAAHGGAVDEGERGHACVAQPAKTRWPEPPISSACSRVGSAACRSDRHRRRRCTACRSPRGTPVARERLVDGGVQARQPTRPQRVRLGVVEAIVQCDQCRGPVESGHATCRTNALVTTSAAKFSVTLTPSPA